ncbi:MAG: homoserine O-acetyltransferase family protein [Usitatibacter sp.]
MTARRLAARLLAAFFFLAIAACQSPATFPRAPAVPASPRSLDSVESKVMVLGDFRLQSGVVLKQVQIAYESYGTLDASGRNAVLITHGNTSTHHAAGRYAPGKAALGVRDTQLGWWDAIIGPGKAFDTDKYFVVSSNMLGGSFGSTGPRSINPATGKTYGPDFPQVTLADMAAAQRALLEGLGVKHLVAVAGPSYGGFLAFQWAVTYPEMMDGVVVVVSSPTGGKNPQAIRNLVNSLAKDPNWNGGWYYDRGGIGTAMTDLRVATLKAYGIERQLAAKYPDPAAREAEIRRQAAPWAQVFDGNSLVVQRKAMEFRDHARDFGRIKAKVLYILSSTDKLFPPSIAPAVMAQLKAANVDATYFELESEMGHSAGSGDAIKFDPALRSFLARLEN